MRTYFLKTTGFYFDQRKQICTSVILLVTACCYIFQIDSVGLVSIIGFIIAIFIQKSIIKDIRNLDEGDWTLTNCFISYKSN